MLEVRLGQQGPIPLDVSLTCAAGEMLALVGPSGSGKTSVLRAIAGLLKVAEGSVSLDGAVWFDAERGIDLPTERRPVGMVFQHYALFPHLSALDNIRLAVPQPRDAAAGTDAARKLLQDMQLDGLAARRPHELSGGQRQRVALARALARRPRVLLLDEAFSAVDQPTRQALYDELTGLRERLSLPIVMVTHDVREARLLADRLSIIERGSTLQEGPPEHVMSRPRNARVAALVGLRDIHAGVFLNQGGARLRWGEGEGAEAIELRVVDKGRIGHGTPVRWVIGGEYVQLHVEPPANAGVAVNLVPCELARLSRLGEVTTVVCRVATSPAAVLHLEVTTRLARQLGLAAGQRACLQLDPQGIHIMPLRPSRQAG